MFYPNSGYRYVMPKFWVYVRYTQILGIGTYTDILCIRMLNPNSGYR